MSHRRMGDCDITSRQHNNIIWCLSYHWYKMNGRLNVTWIYKHRSAHSLMSWFLIHASNLQLWQTYLSILWLPTLPSEAAILSAVNLLKTCTSPCIPVFGEAAICFPQKLYSGVGYCLLSHMFLTFYLHYISCSGLFDWYVFVWKGPGWFKWEHPHKSSDSAVSHPQPETVRLMLFWPLSVPFIQNHVVNLHDFYFL